MAGHTLTARGDSWLLLIGGYSPQHGFNRRLLLYQAQSQRWELAQPAGTPPTGNGTPTVPEASRNPWATLEPPGIPEPPPEPHIPPHSPL